MKKTEAIDEIINQLGKLDNLTKNNAKAYVAQTKSIIIDIFSENSDEYRFFENFNLVLDLTFYHKETFDQHLLDRKEELRAHLTNCVETLGRNREIKQEKESRRNFLSNLNNLTLWSLFVPIIIGTFYIGQYVGQEKTNLENIHLQRENYNLQDRYDSLAKSSIITIPKISNDKPSKESQK